MRKRRLLKLNILVIDDEEMFRTLSVEALQQEGFEVRAVDTLAAARVQIARSLPDILILDRRLPDGDGIAFLSEAQLYRDELAAIIIVTAYGDVENAVEALRSGATDYLAKPLHVPDLIAKLRRIVETRSLRTRLRVAQDNAYKLPRVALPSQQRAQTYEQMRTISRSRLTPVLFTGPSGSGKQFAAEDLHHLTHDGDPDAPFVEVDCGALLESDIEAKLFGYESPVQSDGTEARRGLIELADGGTLFLRDITELPMAIQGKLLKFLDNMRFRRVDSRRLRTVELRVVATSSADLASMVARGKFREDLYHQLAVFVLPISPLADHPDDITPLAVAFCNYFSMRIRKKTLKIQETAFKSLRHYPYPGNIRELRNIMERAVILSRGQELRAEDIILPDINQWRSHLESFFHVELAPTRDPEPLDQVERQYVARVLQHYKGHRTAAAEALGISYPTFLKRLREMGLQEEGNAGSNP